MKAQPRVSIVMPVYNGGAYFELALKSALAQTYSNTEIVIVNDGSTDGGETARIGERASRRHPGRVRYFYQKNGGVASALNTGITQMSGDIFCWLSHDDLFEPEKTARQIDYWNLLDKPDAALISDYRLIDPVGKVLHVVRFDHEQFMKAPGLPLHRGAINGCTVFIPRHVFSSDRPFDDQYRYTQDYWLWHEMSERLTFFHQPELLVRYRLHPGQDSHKPLAVNEGEALWRAMIDGCSENQRTLLYGSSKRFFSETQKIIDPSPYKSVSQHLAEQMDAVEKSSVVSVVIPFKDEVPILVRAVQSVLNQSHAKIELILINDGSSDDLALLLEAIEGDARILLLHQPNEGPGAARNHGLRFARGDYITFLDADDVFTPDRVERQLQEMMESGARWSHSSYIVAAEGTSNVLAISNADRFTGDVYPAILSNCPIATPTVMIHASLLHQGFQFDTQARVGEDILAWVWCAQRFPLLGIRTPLTIVEQAMTSAAVNNVKGVTGLRTLLNRFEADPHHSQQHDEIEKLKNAAIWLAGSSAEHYAGNARQVLDPDRAREVHVELLARADIELQNLRGFGGHALAQLALRFFESAEAYMVLAIALTVMDEHEQAAEAYLASLALTTPEAEAEPIAKKAAIVAAARGGDLAGAARRLQELYEATPADDAVSYQYGGVLASLRQFSEAEAVFRRREMGGAALANSTQNVSFASPPSNLPLPYPGKVKIDIETAKATMLSVDVVNLIACDQGYFDLFVPAACRALERHAGLPAGLHVHVVNPAKDIEKKVEALRVAVGIPIALSTEIRDLSAASEHQRKTYYSCVRFLILKELLEGYSKPMIVTDADQIVIRSVRGLVEASSSADVGLLVFDHQRINILSLVSATAVIARPGKASGRFFDKVSRYLLWQLSKDHAWHLDQAALAVAYLTEPETSVFKVPVTVMSSASLEMADTPPPRSTIFWSITNSIAGNLEKMNGNVFKKYAG